VQQRRRGHHFGVEAHVARNEAQEEPAVPVGPVHHGRNAKPMGKGVHLADTIHARSNYPT